MAAAADKYIFRVSWEPFLLRPEMPPEGIEKAPATSSNPRVNPRLKEAGNAVGIDFTGKCDRYPNTVQAHALLGYAKYAEQGLKQNDLAEMVFKAYFTDGVVPTEGALQDIAEKVGLGADNAKQVIHSEERLQTARDKAKNWSRQGVTGVPCFFMNGQRTFSGAQDVDKFLATFDAIAERFPLKPGPKLPPNQHL